MFSVTPDHSRMVEDSRAALIVSLQLLRETTWPDTFLGRQALIVPENDNDALLPMLPEAKIRDDGR